MTLESRPDESAGRRRRFVSVEERRAVLEAQHRAHGPAFANGPFVDLKNQKSVAVAVTPATVKATPTIDETLYDYFDRVVVISLDRREDRLRRLVMHLGRIDWPFRVPEVRRAVDGRAIGTPVWWRAGGGAWGCLQSHLRIIEDAMMDDVQRLLVLEDDVFFVEDLRERVTRFLRAVPDDWQQLYLGGQHLYQRKRPPNYINDEVVRPHNVNRTHAYALHRRGMRPVYRWLTDYLQHANHPRHHVDHRLGDLHGSGHFRVYAPTRWLAGQAESHSNIKGRVVPQRIWNSLRIAPDSLPFVAVIGLHRSGSSCMAGVLHALGVHMGDRLGRQYEGKGLAAICEEAYPFPSVSRRVPRDQLERRLRTHIQGVQASARNLGRAAGGKYPHLCAMGPELKAVCGDALRLVHIDRPIEESIASLQTRSRSAEGWLHVSDAAVDRVQRWLWDMKMQLLAETDHITVKYHDLLDDPRSEIDRVTEYLGIKPSTEQIRSAIEHVRPRLARHRNRPEPIAEESQDE